MNEKERIKYMRRGLRLAAKGAGWAAPNPQVGAVIVKEGRVIGEGFHRRFGQAHAEVEAIADCRRRGEDPTGAMMFVTLEPCCHQGKTGPCTEAIAQAQITRVEIATLDECELVAGRGDQRLREYGIEVSVGCCEREARRLNAGFFKLQKMGQPQVILKWAQSIDAKLAWPRGSKLRWITNEKSRRHVHKLRSQCGAVLVGSETVLTDDPLLTVRLGRKVWQPIRVVLDEKLSISPQSNLAQTAQETAVIIYTLAETKDREKDKVRALSELGCEVAAAPPREALVDLEAVLSDLGGRGVTDVLVEGGATVLKAFVKEQLADKVMVYIAPIVIGGGEKMPRIDFTNGILPERLQEVRVQNLEGDILLEGYLRFYPG